MPKTENARAKYLSNPTELLLYIHIYTYIYIVIYTVLYTVLYTALK